MADIFGRTCSAGRALEARGNAIAKQAKTFIREKRRQDSRKEIESSVKEVCSYFKKKAVGVDGPTQFFNGVCLKKCLNDGKKCDVCRNFSHWKKPRQKKCKSA